MSCSALSLIGGLLYYTSLLFLAFLHDERTINSTPEMGQPMGHVACSGSHSPVFNLLYLANMA